MMFSLRRSIAIRSLLIFMPLAIGLPADAREAGQSNLDGEPSTDLAILHGRVTNESGAPLNDVLVRVAIPSTDMRFVDATTGQKLLEARTDAKGEYRLEFQGITKSTTISIDAMKPGYRRLVGTLMAGGDPRDVTLVPGKESEADLTLKPARFLGGVIYNDKGAPVSGVSISANLRLGQGVGGVERTTSRRDGSFELYNYPVDPGEFGGAAREGMVTFSHPDYLELRFVDVFTLEKNQLESLRIVLDSGRQVAGIVLDVSGKPVANAMVKVISDTNAHRKATLTDASGKFKLRGLEEGLGSLSVRALEIKQKLKLPITLDVDKLDLELRLQPITLPADLNKRTVLGMTLADATPELKTAYDLFDHRGAVILDPGKNSERLKIGQLAESYTFWMVGKKRVGSIREFVDQLLAETAGQDAAKYSIRIVYSFSTVEFDGTNTQYMVLTKDDIKNLRELSEELKTEPR